jgi:asparagine synthetase B (glutamine-hydrolysing)
MAEIDREYCTSSYLAFRYVVDPKKSWDKNAVPKAPHIPSAEIITVKSAAEVMGSLRLLLAEECLNGSSGIFLSSGIDSACLASLVPKDIPVYTIKFTADSTIDESKEAAKMAELTKLRQKIVEVTWEDYLKYMPILMKHKKSPLHPAEPALYAAALKAKSDGITTIIVGNGADSTFGGMDKLLSKDWEYKEFIERYTFLKPELVLNSPKDVYSEYIPYKKGEGIDTQSFLKNLHGQGIIQMFENAINAAGLKAAAPYEKLKLGIPLDMERIRSGETKYILREVFSILFPGEEIPKKISFARPMDSWMKFYEGPKRKEFRKDIDIALFSGEQKWQLYCLEKYLDMLDSGKL